MNLFSNNVLNDILKYVTVPKLILCGVVIVLAIALIIFMRQASKHLKKKLDIDYDSRKYSILNITMNILKVSVGAAAVIIVLQILGVNVTSIVALIGIIGAIIGLAFQDSLKDIFMGLIILLDGYFKPGDAVEYNGVQGIVINFNLRTTKIQNIDDNSVLSVSNRNISEISKLSDMVDIDLGLSYDEDVKKVYKTLTAVCERAKKLENVEDCMFKGTQNFDDSAIIYKVRFFCKPINRPDTRRAVIREIQKGLDEAGIQIPYRQLVVHSGKPQD